MLPCGTKEKVTNLIGVSSAGILEEGDVIKSVGGQAVGEDGSVAFRGFERISLVHAVTAIPHPSPLTPLSDAYSPLYSYQGIHTKYKPPG